MLARAYLVLLGVLAAIGGVVFVEPAPYDVLLPVLLAFGLAAGFLHFYQRMVPPLLFVGIFLVGSLVSLLAIRSASVLDGARFLGITAYLAASWLFFLGVLGRFGHGAVRVLFAGYAVAASAFVLLVLLALFGRLPVVDQLAVEGRAVAFFKDPNVFGPFLIPVALYAILQVSVERGVRRRLPWALVVTLASVGVLLSLSRAAWGSYALGALTYTLFAFPGSRGLGRRMAVLGLIGLASLLPVWRLAGDEYGELLFSRIGLQPYDDDRFATHSAAAATSLAAWYGIGPGQAETVFDYATHSLYLRVLAENGWISALAFGAFLLATLARSIRGLQDRTGWRPYFAFCTATLTSVLFNSLFIDSLHWRHFWLVCALPWIPYETTSPHHAR